MRKRGVFAGGLLLLLGAAGVFYGKIYRVEPAFSQIQYEYGQQPSSELSDYLVGTAWSVGLGSLDLSQVDVSHTGTYQAVVTHGGKEFSYQIQIADTTPPRIIPEPEQVCLAAGRTFTVEDVTADILDADRDTESFFLDGEELLPELVIDRIGEYRLEILARDSSGNESREFVSVLVDTPPVIAGVHDFYVTAGSSPDYLLGVTAADDKDGSLTNRIEVDISEVSLDREGSYPVIYRTEDSYGLETSVEASLTVASAEELQELIGRRLIDYRRDTILGAPNVYDAGVSPEADMQETLEYMRPVMVQLYHGTGRGGYSSGSGFIMEITEDTVYICTNRHVVSKYQDWDIYFYDGTAVPGRQYGMCDDYDVGVAAVALADVPEELREKLMTVHIDMGYWNTLDRQPLELGLERVDRAGGLIHSTRGQLIKIRQAFEWYEQLEHTEVTLELVHGDSGSAVLDGYGNLICMAYAYSTSPTRYWCVPLDAILECYENITGRTPYVYETGLFAELP